MQVDVVVPEIDQGEDDPIVVGYWFVREGEPVLVGDALVEVMCGKTVFTVASPVSGTVAHILTPDEQPVRSGERLAVIKAQEAQPNESS